MKQVKVIHQHQPVEHTLQYHLTELYAEGWVVAHLSMAKHENVATVTVILERGDA